MKLRTRTRTPRSLFWSVAIACVVPDRSTPPGRQRHSRATPRASTRTAAPVGVGPRGSRIANWLDTQDHQRACDLPVLRPRRDRGFEAEWVSTAGLVRGPSPALAHVTRAERAETNRLRNARIRCPIRLTVHQPSGTRWNRQFFDADQLTDSGGSSNTGLPSFSGRLGLAEALERLLDSLDGHVPAWRIGASRAVLVYVLTARLEVEAGLREPRDEHGESRGPVGPHWTAALPSTTALCETSGGG